MRLSQEERIRRATQIRNDRANAEAESNREYLSGVSLKIKKDTTVFFAAYVSISFIPFYPKALSNKEQVISNSYYVAHSVSRTSSRSTAIVKISTNKLNNYEIQKREMDNHAFSNGDTIITYKNLLLKNTLIYHNKYGLFYSIDTHFGLLLLMAVASITLIILWLAKSYKAEAMYNVMTGTALLLLLIYLVN